MDSCIITDPVILEDCPSEFHNRLVCILGASFTGLYLHRSMLSQAEQGSMTHMCSCHQQQVSMDRGQNGTCWAALACKTDRLKAVRIELPMSPASTALLGHSFIICKAPCAIHWGALLLLTSRPSLHLISDLQTSSAAHFIGHSDIRCWRPFKIAALSSVRPVLAVSS